jgi:hypothetical protein
MNFKFGDIPVKTNLHMLLTFIYNCAWSLFHLIFSTFNTLLPLFNPLTPNNHFSGCTTPLTSKRCILYVYSRNIGVNILNMVYTLRFFFLQNAVCFIILTDLVPVLFPFYLLGVLKFKKNKSGTKRLTNFWIPLLKMCFTFSWNHWHATAYYY